VQAADCAAHARLGVVLDVPHVGEQHRQAVIARRALDLADPPRVRGQLSPQVGEVLLDVARGPRAFRQPLADQRLGELPVAHDARRGEVCAFLADVPAARRHRPRRDAADVCVVRARGREELDAASRRVEHRRHHGHVGQVRAALVR
jgi:hypothetical protein